jgi:hypothetical protein
MNDNIQLVKTQARTLTETLIKNDIKIRYTNALDLICAAYGVRNRQTLKASTSLSPTASALLPEVAARVFSKKPSWIAPAIKRTTEITHPAPVHEPWITISIGKTKIELTKYDLDNLTAFEQSPSFEKLCEAVAEQTYFTRYYEGSQRSPINLKNGNEIGRMIIDAENKEEARRALEEYHRFGNDPEDTLDEEGLNAATILEFIAEAVQDEHDETWEPLGDRDEWLSSLHQNICEKMEDDDDSTVLDLYGSYDCCEVIFWLGNTNRYFEDRAINSSEQWSEASILVPNRDLQEALAPIGYTLTEFRKIANNKQPAVTYHRDNPHRRIKVAKSKMVQPEDLIETIDNACTSYFAFCLYSIVPITELIDIDKTKPIHFSNAKFASYNPMSGTFHNVDRPGQVIVQPTDGTLDVARHYGPDDICGFVHRYFKGSITNVDKMKPKTSARSFITELRADPG